VVQTWMSVPRYLGCVETVCVSTRTAPTSVTAMTGTGCLVTLTAVKVDSFLKCLHTCTFHKVAHLYYL